MIVKKSGEKGIVVKFYSNDTTEKYLICNGVPLNWHYKQELQTDLTAIEKPFGLLSKEVQDELKAVDNGNNMQTFFTDEWSSFRDDSPSWVSSHIYRLSPTYKQEEVKEMTVGEIEARLGHKVKIVKGE